MIVNMATPDPGSIPVRDAATVMLVRDGGAGLEVFMLRRNLKSDFVGGAYVFPGGAVDPEDAMGDVEQWCAGRADRDASLLLEVESGGLAYWVAAIREAFEEAGLLLAVDSSGAPLRFDDDEVNERFLLHRQAVDDGRMAMSTLCELENITLRVDRMGYFSRWVTPLGAPRRYDTRFFVAHAPEGQVPLHDDVEVIANLWIRPADALDRFARGDFQLIFPTVRSLEALTQFERADDVVEHAHAMSRVDAIVPRIEESDSGLRIVLPNDEVYDAVTARRLDPA